MVGLIASFNRIAGNLDASLQRVARQPEIKREAEYYLANIGSIKTVDDFMSNTRVYNFAVKAFGLEDMQFAKAFIRKVLKEGVDSPEAFSVKLADARFREFATTFNFKRYGDATTAFGSTQKGVVDMFMRNALEQQSGEQSESLRLALYFERKSGAISSPYGILADKAVYQVVRTSLGLPQAISGADIAKQARILGEKIDIERLKEPEYTKRIVTRFLALAETQESSTATTPALNLFGQAGFGLDMQTIQSLQTLKKFGF
jgi:hypothetical protein